MDLENQIQLQYKRLSDLYKERQHPTNIKIEELIKTETCKLRALQEQKAVQMRASSAKDIEILDRGLEALDRLDIISENKHFLERILKLYQYLGERQPAISSEHPSHFFKEPGYMRDIEVSPDGSEGALHGIIRDLSGITYALLSLEELRAKLQNLHSDLKERALQKTEKILLRELATKKLEDAGIY